MATKTAKHLTKQEFHSRIKVRTNEFGKLHIKVQTDENLYQNIYDKEMTDEQAIIKFINTWYPIYMDDIGGWKR